VKLGLAWQGNKKGLIRRANCGHFIKAKGPPRAEDI